MKNDDESLSRLVTEKSPARLALAKLISRRNGIEARMRQLEQAANLLHSEQKGEGEAAAKLGEFRAGEATRMADWARNPEGPAPSADADALRELEQQHAAAAAKAIAARQAAASIEEDRKREGAALARIEIDIDATVSVVMIEQAGPMVENLATYRTLLAAEMGRINELFANVVGIIGTHSTSEGAHPAMVPVQRELESLGQRMQAAAAPPVVQPRAGDVTALKVLVGRLRKDPLAELEA